MPQPQMAREAPRELSIDEAAHRLVADLHVAKPLVYWMDLTLTGLTGWGAFVASVLLPFLTLRGVGLLLVSALAFYRGLCLLHEITHLRAQAVRGYETAWNMVFGAPLLLPSFVYRGVHQGHHTIGTYGTKEDPEYLPFSSSHWMTITFTLHSVLIPLALLVRFFVLAPAAVLSVKVRRFVLTYASSLSMNIAYQRKPAPGLAAKMMRWELVVWAMWAAAAVTAPSIGGRPRLLLSWYATTALASLVNAVRTLAAHRYEGSGAARSRADQLLDSVDVEGGWWTELWAPIGLRYHALHHYFPGIPYHNLGRAHRRLMEALPAEAPYRHVTEPSLLAALGKLYGRGRANLRQPAKT